MTSPLSSSSSPSSTRQQRALAGAVAADEAHLDVVAHGGLGVVEQHLIAVALVGVDELQQHSHQLTNGRTFGFGGLTSSVSQTEQRIHLPPGVNTDCVSVGTTGCDPIRPAEKTGRDPGHGGRGRVPEIFSIRTAAAGASEGDYF